MTALPALAVLVFVACMGAARGADPPAAPPDPQVEIEAAFEAAGKALRRGPVELPMAGQGKLALPGGFAFIPPAEGARLMRAMGNSVDGDFQGMVVPHLEDGSFSFYEISYVPSGYIKDDDAKDWKADDLMQRLREGTAEGNKRRVQMGIGEMEVSGWIEPPRYEAPSHQLVWSIGARTKGDAGGVHEGINYRTLVLGREGYLAMTLVTDQAHIGVLRPATATLLDDLTFNPGKRYADFDVSTDHVAEFGLATLVAGVAAKKLGLLALAAAFVVKFAKVIILAVGGFVWAIRRKLWRDRSGSAAAAPATMAPTTMAPGEPAAHDLRDGPPRA